MMTEGRAENQVRCPKDHRQRLEFFCVEVVDFRHQARRLGVIQPPDPV
jgi:hypothetical protein